MLLLLASLPAFASTAHIGKVVGIADSDTLTLLVGTKQLKIRLAESMPPNVVSPMARKPSRR